MKLRLIKLAAQAAMDRRRKPRWRGQPAFIGEDFGRVSDRAESERQAASLLEYERQIQLMVEKVGGMSDNVRGADGSKTVDGMRLLMLPRHHGKATFWRQWMEMTRRVETVVSAHTPVDAPDPWWYKPGSYKNPVGVHEEQATLTPEDSCPQKTPEDAAVGPSGPVPTASMGAASAVQVADIQRPQALTQASALPGSPPR